MRILVTGAGGFLGSHLSASLLAQGHEVLGVDNFRTGFRENLRTLEKHRNFELLRHDITFPLYVEVDQIFNLASPASPRHYQKDPVQTLKTNVLGVTNMLGLAKRLGIPIVQASTSEVYGDPEEHPQSEEYWGNVNPVGTRACYDEGKRAAETICFDYKRMNNLSVGVVRIFNTYGPRMAKDDGRVVSEFVQAAIANRPLHVYGDGGQTRSFCYVTDTIRGLEAAMANVASMDTPINLGNPHEVSIRELGETVIRLAGSKSHFEQHPLPSDDPKRRCPDISKARNILSWEPEVALEEGLLETISHFRSLSA